MLADVKQSVLIVLSVVMIVLSLIFLVPFGITLAFEYNLTFGVLSTVAATIVFTLISIALIAWLVRVVQRSNDSDVKRLNETTKQAADVVYGAGRVQAQTLQVMDRNQKMIGVETNEGPRSVFTFPADVQEILDDPDYR